MKDSRAVPVQGQHDQVEGISFVVCCHNSAERLAETLACLSSQKLDAQLRCEVIVVDNASTDETSQIALHCWPDDCPIPLRVVSEPNLGLNFARYRGLNEARYSVISFVDDDNHLDSDWAGIATTVMSEHPEVGACGGQSLPQVEIAEQPFWFERFQGYYASGHQAISAGDVTSTRGYLWSAGMCVRRQAWENLRQMGFRFQLTGRKGMALSSGEDTELCYALRLTGWRLRYEPRLQMYHHLSPARLKWNYLRRLSREFGAATVTLDIYDQFLRKRPSTVVQYFQQTWLRRVLATAWHLLRKPVVLLRSASALMEGDEDVLRIEYLFGRLLELFRPPRSRSSDMRKIFADKTQVNNGRPVLPMTGPNAS